MTFLRLRPEFSPAVLLLLLITLTGGCASTGASLPDGEDGRGLLQADEQPPAGATTWDAPQWRAGDRFTLERGERLRGAFEVLTAGEEGYAIDMGGGRVLRRNRELGNLGEWQGVDGDPMRVMSPVDVRYHWPLWVGKAWSCEFVDRVRDGQALMMQADYSVEGLDRIEVPAGTFDALRVVRRLRLADARVEGKFLTRTQVAWYSPEIGLEVRQLLGDTLVELIEYTPAR